MKNYFLNLALLLLLVGLLNVYSYSATSVTGLTHRKDKNGTLQDTVTTNKARAKRGVNEVGSGAKEIGKGTKDLAVSGAKATGKGAKKAGKAVKKTTKKGVKKAENAID